MLHLQLLEYKTVVRNDINFLLRYKVAIHSFTTYTLFRGNQTHIYYKSSIACGTPRHQETIES